ncbi:MAG: HAD family hydrolase [Actinomycetes bacterium]
MTWTAVPEEDRLVSPGLGWRPRMLALDVDGTLLADGERGVSARVRAALDQARSAGAQVVLTTGRALCSTLPVADALGLDHGYLVCSNGALVYELGSSRLVLAEEFDPGPPGMRLSSCVPDAQFAVERGTDGFVTTEGFAQDFPAVYLGSAPVEELLSEPTVRMVVRSPGADRSVLTRAGMRVLGDRYGWAAGHSCWLDVMSAGVSKASGAQRVADLLGIDRSEVFAAGDGFNDVELLDWAAWGVAMGQAPPEVRQRADAVTDTVAQDGVATALRVWFD